MPCPATPELRRAVEAGGGLRTLYVIEDLDEIEPSRRSAATVAPASAIVSPAQVTPVTVPDSRAQLGGACAFMVTGTGDTAYGVFSRTATSDRYTPGWDTAVESIASVTVTVAFGAWVTAVTDYSATYGSLGATVGLLTWMYLSAYVFLVGAELNSEIEHQTARDSTTGRPKPLGERGAWAADNVAMDESVQNRPEEVREGEKLTAASPTVADADERS